MKVDQILNDEVFRREGGNLVSDERDEMKKVPIKNYRLLKVILIIILILVILVDIIWRFVNAVIGPYDYRRSDRELHKIIPNAIELFWNNEDKLRSIALEIADNEVKYSLSMSDENLEVYYASKRRNGVYFYLCSIDLSVLYIVCNPDFEYDLRYLAYCKKLCDDWYIYIMNSPQG